MKTLRFAISVYIIVMLLSACGAASEQPNLEGVTWELTAINGNPPIEGTQPTLQFENGQVSGNASCNSFGGEYQIEGDKIGFGALYNTEMFCMEPDGAMDQETTYLAMLGNAATFELGGGVLTIVTGQGESLTFKRP
jgi:heat shock protein HslJ